MSLQNELSVSVSPFLFFFDGLPFSTYLFFNSSFSDSITIHCLPILWNSGKRIKKKRIKKTRHLTTAGKVEQEQIVKEYKIETQTNWYVSLTRHWNWNENLIKCDVNFIKCVFHFSTGEDIRTLTLIINLTKCFVDHFAMVYRCSY